MLLILRPYHILCRIAFSGYGYSPEFIAEFSRLAKVIRTGRVKTIVARPGFDHICRSCPHHEYECSEEKFGFRGRLAAELDHRTLRALRLKPGYHYPMPEIDERIARLSEKKFLEICSGCEWQKLGICLEGYRRLRQRFELEP